MSNIEYQISEKELANCIDHTLLSATATSKQIGQLCEEAKSYGFYSVCVNGRWAGLAADELAGSKIKVCSVISFPLGADSTRMKVTEANEVIRAGANEIDMVADLAAIVEGDSRYLSSQFEAVLKICRSTRLAVVLKVIIESAALSMNEKLFACQIAGKCGVDFIKTSTGLHPAGGATAEDVKLIRQIAPNCKIKAAGGIKTAKQALEMLEAGAERIGTSSGVQIIKEFKAGQLQ
jgi:deoxyribose-phosphate aldolase